MHYGGKLGRYNCYGARVNHGTERCITVSGLSIDAAIADFRKSTDGVRVDAAVTGLRLVGIEFDAKTLRVAAEVDGTVRVAVTKLPD